MAESQKESREQSDRHISSRVGFLNIVFCEV
jgi:hypothetical protein